MALTRAGLTTVIKYTFKRADKDTEIAKALQWCLNDVADDFIKCYGLEEETAELALTTDISYLDISTSLATQHGRRLQAVSLIDSAENSNGLFLTEMPWDNYLMLLPDPSITDDAALGYPEEYARREDKLYFWPVPDYTTLSVKLYFGKVHPTTGDILYPDDWEEMIVAGTLWRIYAMMENTKKLIEWKTVYSGADNSGGLKWTKIRRYSSSPNEPEHARCFF